MNQFAGMRYRLGGRGTDGTIDCYGVAMAKGRELGHELPEVWQRVCEQWRAGRLEDVTGFADGWRRLQGAELAGALAAPRDGDVWLAMRSHVGVGIICGGLFWSATPHAGVVSLPPARVPAPSEVWRR